MKGILIIGIFFIPLFAGQVRAGNTIDVVHVCTSANINAALEAQTNATKIPSKAAQEGEICVAYVNAVVDGYSIGSVTAENYITSYLANQLAQMESAQSGGGDKNIDKMKAALLLATKDTAYDLCLPKDPALDVYPRVVAAYIHDQKISAYPMSALLVIRAVQAKYSMSACRVT